MAVPCSHRALAARSTTAADMEKLRVEVREFAKAAHEALKATEKLTRENRAHERRVRKLEKSEKRTSRRFEGMRDILRILQRLEARSAKRLDQLESVNHSQLALLSGSRLASVGPTTCDRIVGRRKPWRASRS